MKKQHYTLTKRAAKDISDVVSWSLARWGEKRTNEYLDALHHGIEWIANNQKKVGIRQDLAADSGLSIYPIREHYIVFLPMEKGHIAVIAVLRQGRDIPSILSRNSAKISGELKKARQSSRRKKPKK